MPREKKRQKQPARSRKSTCISPTATNIKDLPAEILIEILSLTCFKDILSFQQVCRHACQIVAGSKRLRYIVSLGLANCVDGSSENKGSTSERLKALADRHGAFRQASFLLKDKVIYLPCIPGLLRHWDCQGGLLVCAYRSPGQGPDLREPQPFDSIDVKYIGSHGKQPPVQWSARLGEDWSRFSMDPSQDLLVLWEESTVWHIPVKFLHLSDGTPHKRACPDVKDIELPIHSDCNELQIRGPLIGLSTDKQMIIIDWTTGAKESLDMWPTKTNGFLLSENCLVAVPIRMRPTDSILQSHVAIDVYAVENTGTSIKTSLVAKFELPTPRPHVSALLTIQNYSSEGGRHSDPASHKFSARPFHISPAAQVFGLVLEMKHEDTSESEEASFLVFARTQPFFDAVDHHNPYAGRLRRAWKRVPWQEWVPTGTWWFEGYEPSQSDEYWPSQCGTMVMLRDGLVDLNSFASRRDLTCGATAFPGDAAFTARIASPPVSRDDRDHTSLRTGTAPERADEFFEERILTTVPFRKTYFWNLTASFAQRVKPTEEGLLLVHPCRCGDHMLGFTTFVASCPHPNMATPREGCSCSADAQSQSQQGSSQQATLQQAPQQAPSE